MLCILDPGPFLLAAAAAGENLKSPTSKDRLNVDIPVLIAHAQPKFKLARYSSPQIRGLLLSSLKHIIVDKVNSQRNY